jgi:signal transduction histidine kinase
MGDEERLSAVINNIANIYQTNDQDSIAVGFYNQSIGMERRLGRPQQLATRLGNLSTSYLKLGRLDSALVAVSEALALDRAGTRPDKTAARLTQMADVYKAMDRLSEAEACLTEAMDYFEGAGSLYGMAVSLNALGEIAYERGQAARAAGYFDRAADCATRNGNRYIYQKVAQNIYLANRERDPAKALRYHEQSVAIRDSIFGAETQRRIDEFRVRYDTQGKELEIVRQRAEIERRDARLLMQTGGLLAVAVLLGLSVWVAVLRTRRARALAEMNATKDRFFDLLSHDLKNPAVAQRDALRLLAGHSGEWDSATLSTHCRELLKSADAQVELLYGLLDWARVQTGRMPYRPVRFDLVAALRHDIELADGVARGKGVALEVALPPAAVVAGDPAMIATVVRNLLSNAVKFTPAGGSVCLRVAEERSGIEVSVADTGVGIDGKQLRTGVVSPRPGTAGETGSGLGLAVCRELLEKHGARLHIESTPGAGSIFRFTLAE